MLQSSAGAQQSNDSKKLPAWARVLTKSAVTLDFKPRISSQNSRDPEKVGVNKPLCFQKATRIVLSLGLSWPVGRVFSARPTGKCVY